MMGRRRGRPGLVGMAARTAVVAGTATAVSGSVNRHQQAKADEAAQASQQEQQYAAQQAQAQQYQAPPPQAAAPVDVIGELERLSALKQQGILTEEEFNAQKTRILGL